MHATLRKSRVTYMDIVTAEVHYSTRNFERIDCLDSVIVHQELQCFVLFFFCMEELNKMCEI